MLHHFGQNGLSGEVGVSEVSQNSFDSKNALSSGERDKITCTRDSTSLVFISMIFRDGGNEHNL